MQNSFHESRGKFFFCSYLPNPHMLSLMVSSVETKKGRNTSKTRMLWQVEGLQELGVAIAFISTVSKPMKCKDVEVSFAAPILHFENRCFSSPSYLLCCNKKKISFILDTNSTWQLPACRFIASDLTVRRWILFTCLSQENVVQQEVLLSQKEWVVVVAQQCSYCKVMFMAAPAAELPSGQSLSNSVFQAATVCSAEMLDGGQTPRSYHCLQFVLLPSLRSLSQTSPAVKTCGTSHTLAQVGALKHDLSKDLEKVELSWQSFSFTWMLFGFA